MRLRVRRRLPAVSIEPTVSQSSWGIDLVVAARAFSKSTDLGAAYRINLELLHHNADSM